LSTDGLKLAFGSEDDTSITLSPRATQPAQSLIVRIEDKYFIPHSLKDEVLTLLDDQLRPKKKKLPSPTFIESTYFDSPSLDLYQKHFLSPQNRFKLRVRQYFSAKKNKLQGTIAELKQKKDGISIKFRLSVAPNELHSLLEGNPLSHSNDLEERNPSLSPELLNAYVFRMNNAIHSYSLKPINRVQYRRYAFFKKSLRVTLDKDLGYSFISSLPEKMKKEIHRSPFYDTSLIMKDAFFPIHHNKGYIMEVKHSGTPPFWLTEFLEIKKLKKVSFSKYCFSITEELGR
jgi:SPX domain protein involved in polyphosphate accumulation